MTRQILLGLHVAACMMSVRDAQPLVVRVLPEPREFKVSSKSRKGKGEKRRNRANRWR